MTDNKDTHNNYLGTWRNGNGQVSGLHDRHITSHYVNQLNTFEYRVPKNLQYKARFEFLYGIGEECDIDLVWKDRESHQKWLNTQRNKS